MQALAPVSTRRQLVPGPPRARADVIIDNRDFTRPAVIGPPGCH